MAGFWKAALCGLSFVASGQASAASYLRYTFEGTGLATVQTPAQAFYNVPVEQYFVFNIPLYSTPNDTTLVGADFTTYAHGPTALFGAGTSSITARGNTLTETTGGIGPGGSQVFANFTACLTQSTGGILPSYSAAIDPSCSTFSLLVGGAGGSGTIASGTLRYFNVSLIEGLPPIGGLSSFTTYVPEPSTWALMLAGFGLTGYALRKRRVSVALAPTA